MELELIKKIKMLGKKHDKYTDIFVTTRVVYIIVKCKLTYYNSCQGFESIAEGMCMFLWPRHDDHGPHTPSSLSERFFTTPNHSGKSPCVKLSFFLLWIPRQVCHWWNETEWLTFSRTWLSWLIDLKAHTYCRRHGGKASISETDDVFCCIVWVVWPHLNNNIEFKR